MIGLLAGIDFTPSPSDFKSLLDSGDLVPGLQYVTIELTKAEAENEGYLSTMFQGAAAKQGWYQGIHAKLEYKKAIVGGKSVIIVCPIAASPAPGND